jgi:hypothetical protein
MVSTSEACVWLIEKHPLQQTSLCLYIIGYPRWLVLVEKHACTTP